MNRLQIRMTNDEIRRNDEFRMAKPAIGRRRTFRHSCFGFLSTFDIRHSSFYGHSYPVVSSLRNEKACCAVWKILVCLVILLGFFTPRILGQAFNEYDVKATFLYRFAQFVEWPPEAFPSTTTPLVIGVLGDDPFGKALDAIVKDEFVNKRKLVVQHYRRVEDVTTCHILFISRSEESRIDQILSTLKLRSILTVGDVENFARRGGIIRLLTEQNKIRLRINVEAAKAAQLTISSKVLRVAERVGGGEADK
jgi:hypothetical protein